MLVVVETPKWSFRKLEFTAEGYKRTFSSPVPTPFNYGFIKGTRGEDGMPLDVVILGEKKPSGSTFDVSVIGRVSFIDDGVRDDKYIATLDDQRHEMAVRVFFMVYAVAKFAMGLLRLRRSTDNRYEGIEWFEVGVSNVNTFE